MNIFFRALTVLLLCYCPIASAQDNTIYKIDTLMTNRFKPDEPGGTALVAKDGKIIYQKAFGMAQMELGVPSDTGMVYYIASNTKQFTAVAILQLVEKGLIALNDSLGKYVNSKPPVSQITIRQMLSHTSGLNGNGYADSLHIPAGDNTQAEAERYAARNMAFPAGSKWQYNNANFQVLGHIIEKLSGKTYQEYIIENIFKPAGMSASYVASDEPLINRRATGYGVFRRGIVNMPLHDTQGFFASGGILSTAMDMYKWNQALKSGILLNKKTLEQAFAAQKLNNGQSARYGFGWYIDTLRGSLYHRHGGLIPGFMSETLYLPAEDIYVVILLNSESGLNPQVLSRIIAAELAGKPFEFKQSPIERQHLGGYAGLYENDRGEQVNITEADGKMYFQRPKGRRYELKHSDTDQFYLDKDFIWVEFKRGKNRKVDNLVTSWVGTMPSTWSKTGKPVLQLNETGQVQP
ncbi:serine hydrolase [uncultured Chitinophaga sp.]|uniref:serine hydrolase n=1 Tax=uncultured Chitinophaga sp. TaxID=339340 RepID=UPI0025CEBA0A|nr:serine hydrolase [uncultured Chitinophaga sp.]